MSYTKRRLEDLNVLDDFLMTAVATDPNVGNIFCRTLLSVLLQKEIGDIRVIAQRVIPAISPEHRGIRMDIEIEEIRPELDRTTKPDSTDVTQPILNLYDLEPHLHSQKDYPRHNRFYQAKIDGRYMNSGENNFSHLPNLYIINITDFDPFGFDYMLYTIQNACVELPEMPYQDGLQFLYFYTKGTKSGSSAIKSMLNYLHDSSACNVSNQDIQTVHNCVERVKILPEVKQELMKFDEIVYYAKQDGKKEGKAEGKVESILELLQECGPVPENLKDRLLKEELPVLTKLLKIAARAKSIEEFMKKYNELV